MEYINKAYIYFINLTIINTMKKYLFLTFVFFLMGVVRAKDIDLTGQTAARVKAAIETANDGDVFIFSTDILGSGARITLPPKSITLKAAPGLSAKPRLEKCLFMAPALSPVSITFDGLEMFYSDYGKEPVNAHFFTANDTLVTIPNLTFKNCNIHGWGRCVLRADASTRPATIGTIEVDSCIFSENSTATPGHGIFNMNASTAEVITIKNSTFYNCAGSIVYFRNPLSIIPISFTFDRNTVLNCGSGVVNDTLKAKRLFQFHKSDSSSYIISNSIFKNYWVSTPPVAPIEYNIGLYPGTGTTYTSEITNTIIDSISFYAPVTGWGDGTGILTTRVSDFTVDVSAGIYTLHTNALVSEIGDPRFTLGTPVVNDPYKRNLSKGTYITLVGQIVYIGAVSDLELYDLKGVKLIDVKQVSVVPVNTLPKGAYIVKAGRSIKKIQVY